MGKVLLNRWLSFVNGYALGCCLQGQTFNHLQLRVHSFDYLGNFKTGGGTFLQGYLQGCLGGCLTGIHMPLMLSIDSSLIKFIFKTE